MVLAHRGLKQFGLTCRRVMGVAAVALAVVHSPIAAQAAGKHAAFIIDANTGAVISAQDADAPRFPASLTKMMTLYLLFEQIEQGKLNPQSRIKISDEAASAAPSKLGLDAGSDITVADAIKALIVKSANDIAVAVAEHIAGTEEKFARRMTDKARQLGMPATTFRNAHGLPDSAQTTTARDIVTLALRLHDDFPRHYPLFATREFRFNGDTHRNHNTLLFSYEGSEGMKTGYTRVSGFNLVSSVKRGNKHVVGAVFGGASASSRNQTMRTLLNIALFKASPTKTRLPVALASAKPAPQLRETIRPAQRQGAIADTSRSLPVQSDARPDVQPERQPSPPIDVRADAATEPRRPAIDIARVRPIIVVPHQQQTVSAPLSPPAAAPTAIQQPIKRAELAAPSLPTQPQRQAIAPITPVIATAPALRPTQQAFAPAPTLPSSATALAPARGLPPSSLQAQAESLSRGSQPAAPAARPGQFAHATFTQPGAAPASRLQGPAPSSLPQHQIQIGAYATASDAERQLAAAKAKAPDLIGSYQGVALPAQSAGKAIYRARLTGFDAGSAGAVCTELRRRQIDCMVTKEE
jgi:D-alanyl-D-alanine carboxypeptidase